MIASASAFPRDIEEDATMFNRDTTDAETRPAEKINASTSMNKNNISIAKIERSLKLVDFVALKPKHPSLALEPVLDSI